ncbi:MAG: shikimate dehydrogenase family protein [Gemmatimonadota bacterium]
MTSGGRDPRDEGHPGPSLFALLGDPVAHSHSPTLHAASFEALGIDAVYAALRVLDEELKFVMRTVARQGGGGNVTLPHKERAAAVVDDPSEAVRATGACNCFWGDGAGGLRGDNTDVDAFAEASRSVRTAGPADATILLLGAGGAARAVLRGALSGGAREVHVLNRTAERAFRMVSDVAVRESGDGERVRVLESRDEADVPYDLVVNATSLGIDPDDPLPLDLVDREVGAVLDLVYGPDETAWVRRARELGVRARDGLEMLVLQGAASVERWTGRRPPLEPMRRAVRKRIRSDVDRRGGSR